MNVMTVRELIMALLLNTNLDDLATIQVECPCEGAPNDRRFVWGNVVRTCTLEETGEAIIECIEHKYDEEE